MPRVLLTFDVILWICVLTFRLHESATPRYRAVSIVARPTRDAGEPCSLPAFSFFFFFFLYIILFSFCNIPVKKQPFKSPMYSKLDCSRFSACANHSSEHLNRTENNICNQNAPLLKYYIICMLFSCSCISLIITT